MCLFAANTVYDARQKELFKTLRINRFDILDQLAEHCVLLAHKSPPVSNTHNSLHQLLSYMVQSLM